MESMNLTRGRGGRNGDQCSGRGMGGGWAGNGSAVTDAVGGAVTHWGAVIDGEVTDGGVVTCTMQIVQGGGTDRVRGQTVALILGRILSRRMTTSTIGTRSSVSNWKIQNLK